MNASIRIVLTNEFGDSTDITKSLTGSAMDEVYHAIGECLAGCGYADETIQEWFYAELIEKLV